MTRDIETLRQAREHNQCASEKERNVIKQAMERNHKLNMKAIKEGRYNDIIKPYLKRV